VSALLGFSVTNALIGVLAYFSGLSLNMRGNIVLYSLVALLNFTNTPIGVLRLLNKFHYFMAQEFITSILGIVGAAFVHHTGGGVSDFITVIIVSKLVGTIYLVLVMVNELRKGGFLRYWQAPFINWRPFANFTLWNYLTHFIAVPTKQLDVIIVSAVVTIEAAGIYKIIKQVADVIGLLVNPVYYAIYPQFTELIAQGKQGTAFKFAAKSGLFSLLLVSPIAVLLSTSSPWWLGAVFGAQFTAGWIPLMVFLFVKVFEFSCNPIHPLFKALGFVKQESLFFLLSSGIYLLLVWQLGLRFGLIGIIIAHGFETLFLLFSKFLHIKHNMNRQYIK